MGVIGPTLSERWIKGEHGAGLLTEADAKIESLQRALDEAIRELDRRPDREAVDVFAATDRVAEVLVSEYGARDSNETREQARRLAEAALGGQSE